MSSNAASAQIHPPQGRAAGGLDRPSLRARALESLIRLYVLAFGRPELQFVNTRVLKMALRARGYDNCGDFASTGEAKLIERIARTKPKLCIDVGANKGDYSRALLENTAARVIAFEPLPRTFARLLVLADRYPGRLIAVNRGVGDVNAELELHYSEADSELASFSSEVSDIPYVAAANRSRIAIPVTTLDSYLEAEGRAWVSEGIDLLKVDTEGFEYNVLLGARRTLASLRPKFIQLEMNWHQLFRGHSLHGLAALLEGYRVYQLLPRGGGLLPVSADSPESNIFRYSNFVFVRNDVTL
jgi:FkbM family methyltransferase